VLLLGELDSMGQPNGGSEASTTAPPDDRQRVLALITAQGAMSSGDAARALRLSSSTVLRLLRGLCAEGLLERQGGGRSTRYRRAAT
jgi:predicted ArsR family transcriptional regulator